MEPGPCGPGEFLGVPGDMVDVNAEMEPGPCGPGEGQGVGDFGGDAFAEMEPGPCGPGEATPSTSNRRPSPRRNGARPVRAG